MILAIIFINKSFLYILPNFESVGPSVEENKFKIDFQDGGHLELLIETMFAIFDLQVALIRTSCQVSSQMAFL